MTFALASHVIADFDGTLVQLEVDWDALRRALAVDRVQHLWEPQHMHKWETVTAAETRAAASSPAVETTLRALDQSVAVAILTNNAEAAVHAFLTREPALAAKVSAVVGRESLGGPKTDFEFFRSGYETCCAALDSPEPPSYVGDMQYELEFARRLGATAVDVSELREPGSL